MAICSCQAARWLVSTANSDPWTRAPIIASGSASKNWPIGAPYGQRLTLRVAACADLAPEITYVSFDSTLHLPQIGARKVVLLLGQVVIVGDDSGREYAFHDPYFSLAA